MSFATILALDLGKFKSVLCIMDVAIRTHRFLTVESSPTAIRDAIAQQVSTDPALTLPTRRLRWASGRSVKSRTDTGR